MKIQIVTIGEPQLSFAKEGIMEYTKRANRFSDIEFIHIKEGKNMEKNIEKTLEGTHVILMDEKGTPYTSHSLSQKLENLEQHVSMLTLYIGGPDGHNQETKEKYRETLSLSELTLPHDLAMLFTMETLYRSLSISNNHPYHRE